MLGASAYNRGTVTLNKTEHGKMDVRMLGSARGMIGFHGKASGTLTHMISALPTSSALSYQSKYRLIYQLHLHPNQNIPAVRMLRALQAEPRSAASLRGKLANQVHTDVDLFARVQPPVADIPGATPLHFRDVKSAAKILARAAGYRETQLAAWKERDASLPAQPCIYFPPSSDGSRRHAFYLSFGMVTQATELGMQPDHTQISVLGARTSGSMMATADGGPFYALVAALLGFEALAWYPFAPVAKRALKRGSAMPAYNERYTRCTCRLCGVGDEDIFHLAFACTHFRLADAQQRILGELRHVARGLANACADAMARSRLPPVELTADEDAALTSFLAGRLPAARDEVCMLGYWLLLAVPWPRAVPAAAGFHAAAALGAVFDATNVSPSLLRKMATCWCQWSEDALVRLGADWQEACRLAGPALPAEGGAAAVALEAELGADAPIA